MVILLGFGPGDGGSTPLGTIPNMSKIIMESVLVVGVNARPVACSLRRCGYEVISVDYFGVRDLIPCVKTYKSILDHKPFESSGFFLKKYDHQILEETAQEFIDQSDKIICLPGISPQKFPKKKIIGNRDIKKVSDKYWLYQKLKKDFTLPKTFNVSDIQEVREIIKNFPEKKFLIKPRTGSGGYGIRNFENYPDQDLEGKILQEKITGVNLSASVMSSSKEVKTILTSQQLIGISHWGQLEPFGYCGNIVPYLENQDLINLAEDIISLLGLLGSNGVDFVYDGKKFYIIEVNPYIQGTFECAELSLGINMSQAHMMAVEGEMFDFPAPQNFVSKIVLHAKERSQVVGIRLEGIKDLPGERTIIEKGEPYVTILCSDPIRENMIFKALSLVEKAYNKLKPSTI